MATIYHADDEASRRAAANLNNALAEFSQPTRPQPTTRSATMSAPATTASPAAPVATRPQVQQPFTTRLGRRIGDDAAWAADAISLPANTALNAANRGAMGVRNVVRAITGKPALEPAQVGLNRFRRSLWSARAANVAQPQPPAPAQTSATPSRPPVTPSSGAAANPAQPAATTPPNRPATADAPGTYKTSDGSVHAMPPGITMTTGPDGVRTVSQSGVVQPNQAPAIGSVASQNFGTVPASTVSYGQRPQVASTFGLSANDPRLNDANQGPQRPQASLRGPDAMSEAYNASADREARQRLASDLDSERFRLGMIAGEGGNRRSRAALEALGQNAQQRAQIASGAEALSAAAAQGRANRDNALAAAGMQEQGQTFRAQLDAQNRADIAGMQNVTEQQRIAAGVTRPMFQGGDGTFYQASNNGGAATTVTDAQGNPIRGAVQRPQIDGALEGKRLEQIGALANQLLGVDPTTGQIQDGDKSRAPTPEEVLAARDVAARAIGGGGGQQPTPMRAGEVRNGVRFKGGDPNDENNYERVTAAGR